MTPAQTSLLDQNELGGVLNDYFARHWVKLQFDYLHLWNRSIVQGTDQVRLQLQAMFASPAGPGRSRAAATRAVSWLARR